MLTAGDQSEKKSFSGPWKKGRKVAEEKRRRRRKAECFLLFFSCSFPFFLFFEPLLFLQQHVSFPFAGDDACDHTTQELQPHSSIPRQIAAAGAFVPFKAREEKGQVKWTGGKFQPRPDTGRR